MYFKIVKKIEKDKRHDDWCVSVCIFVRARARVCLSVCVRERGCLSIFILEKQST